MTEASLAALDNLRSVAHFQWALVPIFALVISQYYAEIGKRNWHLVLACLGAFFLELLGEVGNALILHFTGYAALWTIGGDSSYLIFVGLNVEISLMFAIAYLAMVRVLPADRAQRVLGLPNRWFFVWVNSGVCVLVESILNAWGVLVWDWHYWSWPHVWSIVLFAYAPSIFFLYWLYDLKSLRRKAQICAGLGVAVVTCVVVFVGVLGWI